MDQSSQNYQLLQEEITQLRRKAEDLEQRNQQYEMLFSGLREVLMVMNHHGRYLDIPPSNQALLYQPREALIGKTLHDVMPTDQADFFLAAIHKAIADGEMILEYSLEIHNQERWFEATYSPIQGERVLVSARDITERKQAEHALRREQQLFFSGPIVIFKWVAAANWPVEYVSPNISQFGYTVDELVSGRTPYASIVYPEDLQRVGAEVQHYSQTGAETFEQSYRIVTSTGAVRWTYDFTRIVRDPDGTISHYDGYILDITEQKEAEAERERLQNQVISAQQAALRELSTPLIPISEDIVVMPLVGTIDPHRAQQIIETLLEGVARYGANTVIIDITGVELVDTHVADALIRAAKAARLLGTMVVLSGIRPEVAQTLVQLGTTLDQFVTRSNLQTSIAYALSRP